MLLLSEPGRQLSSGFEGVEWRRFPLGEMLKRGWFSALEGKTRDTWENAEEVLAPFLSQHGLKSPAGRLAATSSLRGRRHEQRRSVGLAG